MGWRRLSTVCFAAGLLSLAVVFGGQTPAFAGASSAMKLLADDILNAPLQDPRSYVEAALRTEWQKQDANGRWVTCRVYATDTGGFTADIARALLDPWPSSTKEPTFKQVKRMVSNFFTRVCKS